MPHAPSSLQRVFRLVSLAALLLAPRAAQAQSRDVPYRPDHELTSKRPVSLPVCPMVRGWAPPARADFEQSQVDFEAERARLEEKWRATGTFARLEAPLTRPTLSMDAPPGSLFAKALPSFKLDVAVTTSEEGPRARIVKATGPSDGVFPWKSGTELRTFVDHHREWFGVPRDPRLRLEARGNSVILRYPNGAISHGEVSYNPGLGCHENPRETNCFCRPRGAWLDNALPPYDPATLEEPLLGGDEAIDRLRDVAPYVSLLPLDDDPQTPRIATTLVVTSLRAGESRLAWYVRYRYECRNSDTPGDLGHRQWIAYVDAKNGVVYWDYLWRHPGW
jgi:hypothetical protein